MGEERPRRDPNADAGDDAHRHACEGSEERVPTPQEPPPQRIRGGNRAKRRESERLLRKSAKTVATLNMNGFGELTKDHPRNKWGMISRMMTNRKIAVLLLQETHLTEERRIRIEEMFCGRLKIFSSADPVKPQSRNGVAIVVNRRLMDTTDAKMTVIEQGRAIQLTLNWARDERRSFLCVYAPSSGPNERSTFFKQVQDFYKTRTHLARPQVMGGDFNNVEDGIDKLPCATDGDDSLEALDDLKGTLGLQLADGWRATFPDAREFTFFRNQQNGPYFARLDRIYTNARTFETARQWKIQEPGVYTDHSLASVQINCDGDPEMGKGRPKLSEIVIKDKKYAQYVKNRGLFAIGELEYIRDSERRTATRNALQVLEDFSQDCFHMGREREKSIIPKAQQKINAIRAEMKRMNKDKSMPENERLGNMAALTKQLRSAEIGRHNQQKHNARARHRLEGEIPTAYWTRLHKEVKPRDVIHSLEKEGTRTNSGDPVYEQDSTKMAEMTRQYHWHLQEDDQSDPNMKTAEEREADITSVLSNIEKKLDGDRAEEMGKPIDYEEVLTAL
ncbi:Endonuclease/exonuclease/phosphatase, partial [Schizophyllum commune]